MVGVVVFPGSNCDRDCYWVIKSVLGQSCEYIWYEEENLSDFDCIILPGGFSYGDYLRAGAIAKVSPVMRALGEFISSGKLVLGICNGFQILLESGYLPGAMLRNKNLKFICEWVYIRVENNKTPFTCACEKGDVLKIPIAHMEGNFFATDRDYKRLCDNNQIIFRYCSPKGEVSEKCNPNGSMDNIAGICNVEGNVLGMMPHPERASEGILGSEDGLKIFESIVSYHESRRAASAK